MLARIGLLGLVVAAAFGSLLFSASPCLADWNGEEEHPPADRSVNSIHAGATSIQFLTFGGSYRAPAFRTSGIYFKTHLSDRGALRVGTEFTFDESSAKSPPGEDLNSSYYTSYSFSVSAEIDRYVDATGPVTVFLGVGPYWSRSDRTEEGTRTFTYSNSSYFEYYRVVDKSWEIGGSAGVGFEWFFKRKLSLLGRVGASLGFGNRKETRDYQYSDPLGTRSGTDHSKSTTAAASTSSAALGLGVYF